MSDLTDFGVEIPDGPASDEEEDRDGEVDSSARTYRNGRCPAINVGDRRRCAAPVSRMKAADGFCGTHRRERDPWTIDSDPEELILLTGELDALSLDQLESHEVDFDLERIRAAVETVQEADP